jgi:hypothetical protein
MDREITIDGGILAEECKGLLLEFFSKVRQPEET